MNKLFGTDGIRGIANKELNSSLAFEVARAGGYFLTKDIKKRRPKIVLGTDTRISKDMIEGALVAGLTSIGVDVLAVGVIPTPGVAYLTKELKADGGIVVSASHNPVEYNGIKFFNKNGYKLDEVEEEEIEKYMNSCSLNPVKEDLGRKTNIDDGIRKYINFLKKSVKVNLDGLKIALDCGNGASFKAAPLVFNELGAEVYVVNEQPNGLNINVNCGSTSPEEIKTLVKETKADIGFSFDGDADRVIAVDEKGELIDGDKIMASISLDLKEKGKLKNNTLVATLMSNLGLDIYLKSRNINIVKTTVGDRNVLDRMKNDDYIVGGEQSGHVILLEYNTTGDGMLTGLKLAEILKNRSIKASKLAEGMKIMPQTLKNAKVSNSSKYSYLNDDIISKSIKEIEKEFSGKGRVYIRPSGTEPLVRVMIEGENQNYIEEKALNLVKLIEDRLN